MTDIHPSAIVDPAARIGANVTIGPFCTVGPNVVLGDSVVLKSHVVVTGDTHLGAGTTVFPFAVLGEVPQDLKYGGEPTRLRIGAANRIREHVTMNTGTAQGGGETRVGDGGLFMAGCHVAHDAQVGHRVIVANAAAIAGHCVIGDDAVIGGLAGVHQWVRVGQGAMIGALAMVTHDVIPFGLVQGPRGELDGLNLVGLKRRGVPREDIHALRAAFDRLGGTEGSFQSRARALADNAESPWVQDMLAFVLGATDRQFLTPK
jgi:UDP-N-acetylglucosamine acyltransferase